mmetsp:Transcript_33642/g.85047  ORF Transcript_33642/g.85047 Transcript_33642/m.85047 type:complete len:389 (+) Transcript_33642:129-1295(+)
MHTSYSYGGRLTPSKALMGALMMAAAVSAAGSSLLCGPVDTDKSGLAMKPGSDGSLVEVSFWAHNAGDQAASETLFGALEPVDENGNAGAPIAIDETCTYAPFAPGGPCGVYTCSRNITAPLLQAVLDDKAEAFSFRAKATITECPSVTGPDGQSAIDCAGLKVARWAVSVDRGVEGQLDITVIPPEEEAVVAELVPEVTVSKDELVPGERTEITLGTAAEGFSVLPAYTNVWATWVSSDGTTTERRLAAGGGEGFLLDMEMATSGDLMRTVVSFTAKPPASQNGVLTVQLPATLILDWDAEAQVPGQVVAGGGESTRRTGSQVMRVSGRRAFDVTEEPSGGQQPSAFDYVLLGMVAAVCASSVAALVVAVKVIRRLRKGSLEDGSSC